MAGDLNNHAPFAGGHGDGGQAMGGKPHDQAHTTTDGPGAQAPDAATPDFPALQRAIDQARASGGYGAFCEARRALLLAQAAVYERRPQ
jgi:hypothetical protein